MTALTTYVGLQAAVKDWANRMDTSVSGRVTDFIRLGEERIWITGEQVVRSQVMLSPQTLSIPANQNWVALPTDWLGFDRIRSAADTYMEWVEPALLESLPAPGDSSKYSIEGGRLMVGQTPTANLALTVRYYKHPGYLEDGGTPVPWLLTVAPSIYLWAALIEAAIYVKKSDKVAEYGALLAKAISGRDSAERASYVSGGALRIRRS